MITAPLSMSQPKRRGGNRLHASRSARSDGAVCFGLLLFKATERPMGTLVLGVVFLVVAAVVRTAGKSLQQAGGRGSGALIKLVSLGLVVVAVFILVSSSVIVIPAGQVGVRYA